MSISDSFIIINNYSEHIEYFINGIAKRYNKNKILKKLELSRVIAISNLVGTKNGNVNYNNWRRELIIELEDLEIDKLLTVFEKLKRNKGKNTNTVFDKLKRIKYGI